jgi:hypothetical protein
MRKIGRIAWLALACPLVPWAQTPSPAGTPVQVMVTVGHHYGHPPPVLAQNDLIVTQRYEPQPITDLIPLQGDRAGLELFLLVDNCSNCEPGSKFEELRRFIVAQLPTTAVGVAYIQDGKMQVIERPTHDHERAVKALSAPTGSKTSNPFGALADLIKGWPQGSSRRAVLMISNGMQDQSVEEALEAAQRAGVTVYAIYHPSADYLESDITKIYDGQVRLAHVATETGGEAYFSGFGPLSSLAPFLADIADHLANQYLLEFLANPEAAPGALQEVTVRSKSGDIELTAPVRVWVPGSSVE